MHTQCCCDGAKAGTELCLYIEDPQARAPPLLLTLLTPRLIFWPGAEPHAARRGGVGGGAPGHGALG